jgi:putative ABC transport system permease protein
VNTLVTLPVRYLLGRKLRTLLTTLAVVFGVAVIFGVNVLLPTLTTAIQSSLLGASGQGDVTISSATGETFGADAANTALTVPGVVAAAPSLRRELNIGAGGAAGQLTLIGVDPVQAERVGHYALSEGRFLQTGDDTAAVVSQPLAQTQRLQPGGSLKLPTPQGLTELRVVGLLGPSAGDQVIIPLATMQRLFALPGRINTVDAALGAGIDRDSAKAALASRLGPGYNVGTIALESDAFANIQIGLVAVNFFGILTLFMGGFLIFNTFRTIVVERRHDIGMLRAVGATRRNIMTLILTESLFQGVVGTAAGLLLGYGFAVGLNNVMAVFLAQFIRVRTDAVVITPVALLLAVGLGIGVTLAAGIIPALGASRVSVLAALKPQPEAIVQQRVSRGALIGGGLLVLAVLGMAVGTANIGAGAALLFLLGLVLVAPVFVQPIARLGESALRFVFAGEGPLAAGNMQRQPGRAAVTASALMIALAIIISLNGVMASISTTFLRYLDRSLAADVLMVPPSLSIWGSDVGAGAGFEQNLAAVPGIGAWVSLRYAAGQVNGTAVQVLGVDPRTYPQVSALTFDQGDATAFGTLATGRTAIANPIFATTRGLKLGDSLALQTPEGVQSYRIAGIGTDYLGAKINTLYISQANLAADFHRTEDVMVMANLAPGADRAAVKAGLTRVLARYPQFTMYWGADLRAEQRSIFDQVFVFLYVVLAVLIIPSLLGLINTLAINVLERTREIGVLRAIGATRTQIRRMVIAEALLLSMLGAALGILAGLALGYGLTAAMAGTFGSGIAYSFPLAGILGAVAVALLMAVLASVLPARQAARMRIVNALQYE